MPSIYWATLAAYKGHISKSTASRSTKEINSLYLAFVRQHLECCVQFCASLYKKDMDILEVEQWSATKKARGWNSEGKAARAGCVQLPGDLTLVFAYPVEGSIEERARLFSETCTCKESTSCNKGNFFTVRVVNSWSRLPRKAGKIFQLGNIQSLTGHGPALANLALDMKLDLMISRGPLLPHTYSDSERPSREQRGERK